MAFVDDRFRRLHVLANDSPKAAVGAATGLVESVCRTVLRLIGEPAPGETADLLDIAESTLKALELVAVSTDDAKNGVALVGRSLQQLSVAVANFDELQNVDGLLPRHARLAVGAALTFARFAAETYEEQTALKSG